MMSKYLLWLVAGILLCGSAHAVERKKLNFNAQWLLCVGDAPDAKTTDYDDSRWQRVTLPYAFNGDEAFRKDIVDLTDTIVWYRKHFVVSDVADKKVFVEFEGVRQGADFYLNGQHLGDSENGVMACGFDLTPYLKEGSNVLAVRCDNNWQYRSRKHNSRYQWNDRNFNANYGGIPKNVFLHITGRLYQTLPLYSNLETTGTYVYATDFDIAHRKAVVHVESQVRNEDIKARIFTQTARLLDADGREVARLRGKPVTLQAGETRIVKVQQLVEGLHFWSWGYGYLYTVKSSLDDGDEVTIRTGFRKTRFGEGKIWLNDRVMMVHGYAQRTSNEWPGVGLSVPAWLSDYSNGLMVESGGNMVRWMHVTPWKQDIESCDRVGLPQAMPAGDAEKDVEGPRWAQRTELMRDAIIYNRNNPSILFYECGNESISREHMLEMKKIRDAYDPNGGRAIGSREMLDIDEAEYGGEMLYINKSKKHPMWAMEYCRDEGLRKYWDDYSYPYHQEGDGPLYRGKPATDYNHNMDNFTVEMVRRWYDYWLERPGTGTRVSSGGVKIVFSDTNTHHRGESNYRTSGVTDAMRIPKDAFYAHQVMWSGWVDDEMPRTYIVGHWNYDKGVVKPVYVVSTADEVELLLNGKSLGKGRQQYRYLFTFDQVKYEPGTLEAVGSDGSRYQLETTGEPYQIKLTTMKNPEGMKADGADMALIQVEVLDKQGRRCPLDDRQIHFELWGEGKWIGGIGVRNNKALQQPDVNRPEGLLDAAATKNISDNYVGAYDLPVECGINRVLVISTVNAGTINLSAYAEGVKPAYATIQTEKVDVETYLPQLTLKGQLSRGETPLAPSYDEQARGIRIVSAQAGYDSEHAVNSFDDNELSEWKNDGRLATGWITYQLDRKTVVDDICLKLTGWRLRSYPLEVYAGKELIWSGETERSLGYIHLKPTKAVKTNEITIRLKGAGKDQDAFGGIVEVAEPAAGELDLFKAKNGDKTKSELRIVEIEFLEKLPAQQLVWFDGKSPITYQVQKGADPVVMTALDMWKNDMKQVTGFTPEVAKKAAVKIVQRKGPDDDGFSIRVENGQIVIEGNNGRGAAYGLLELSRMAGVSPWIWWGDIVPEKKTRLTIARDFTSVQKPSVAYRGIFINDEDWSLRPWSHNNYEPGPNGYIGPKTYKRIFQMLLRLRANAIWPAMHTGTTAFFKVEGAKAVADSCGIVIGTSHCEPLLRNNVDEWKVAERGPFNYRTNKQQVHEYWTERLQQVKGSQNNIFTIGMRGIHDSSMEGYSTMTEKFAALQQVIDDQQVLLKKHIGEPSRLTQMFVPYKEVLQLYEQGLRVPDYVTLMWCDDNYGYMTRFSDTAEQQRKGGAGVYYHLSYWGRPHDYLWLTTTQPGLVYYEMRQAYDHHVRKMWIVNVHDLKVAGYNLELFLDMAWNIDAVTPATVSDHYRSWLCRQFGTEVGEKIAPAMTRFYQLCGMRRPEFMGWTQVELDKKRYHRGLSPVTKTEMNRAEAACFLKAYDAIRQTVEEGATLLPQRLKDAYFGAIVYPVKAAAAMANKILSDSAESHRAYEEIQKLTSQYQQIANGKWRGLMDAAPRLLPVFNDVRAELAQDNTPEPAAVFRQASQYDEASEGTTSVQMLGHSMNAVAIPKEGRLTYLFNIEKEGDYTLVTALIPTQPVDSGDLRYEVSVDGGAPVTYSLKEPFRSEQWKQNVLRGQARRSLPVHLSKGQHQLSIKALDEHIVVDQWWVDAHPDRKAYLAPVKCN